ncbi:MAG: hypothetical protein U5K27_02725 [Desulfotignum sp.]|nr:hypothetical protein [Desulfotignum sp.]
MKQATSLKHLGDIMVDMGMLTQAEKQMVVMEQNRLQRNDRESFPSTYRFRSARTKPKPA